MPEWFTGLTVAEILTGVGGLVAVVALFRRVWRSVRPVWKGVREFLEDWRGEEGRPGVPERPGVMARLATIEADSAEAKARLEQQAAALVAIDHELHPNSGSSLRDQVDRVAKHVGVQPPK
ncbi:hypothetical protein [Actinosynnema mirum]|uniref:Uncharacterized protein n=1 Tax=Actinosynnema mirum (strain ATCC 29888 / DSM 43827 / JCM 3225 / NBRC 14064 / NCIMB 13271 / NRRL B-12336 / IMRU 3971 / 101) TaxID=446462 RepID=C6WBM3_ACTMD|nr:hypothetical protein [Actinosynnema mirum]ACU35591.1 hypothetical protein Amir_1642 [Actinosynnema mirum DSM 43827]